MLSLDLDCVIFFFLTHDVPVILGKCHSREKGGWFLGQDPMCGPARELQLSGYL